MISGSILSALVWEQWRLSRAELLLRVSLCGSGIWLLSLVGPLDQSAQQVLRGILTFLVAFAALFSASWTNEFDSRQLGFTFRLGFTRPVSTSWLVMVPILYALLGSTAFFSLGCAAVHWATGLSLPWLGPLSITLCTVCLFIAGAWSSTRLDGRIAGMVIALGLTLGWLGVRHAGRHETSPLLLAIGQPDYFQLTWGEFAALGGVALGAVLWSVFVVDRQRHGRPLRWSALQPESQAAMGESLSQTASPPAAAPQASLASTPWALSLKQPVPAQLWFEARSGLPLVPLACLLLPAGLFAFLSVNLQWHLAPRAWLGAMLVIPVVVQFLASDAALGLTHQPGAVWLSSFVATRPMRCDQLISIKLMIIFAWSLVGLFSTMVCAAVHGLLAARGDLWQELWQSLLSYIGPVSWNWWWLAALAGLALFLTSTCTVLAYGLWVARFPKLMLGSSYLFLAQFGLLAWDASHGWKWTWLWSGLGYFWPLVVWGISLGAIVYVLRGGVIGKWYALSAAILWGGWAIVVLWLLTQLKLDQPLPVMAYWYISAYLVGSLAAAALAPLGLAFHRHR